MFIFSKVRKLKGNSFKNKGIVSAKKKTDATENGDVGQCIIFEKETFSVLLHCLTTILLSGP